MQSKYGDQGFTVAALSDEGASVVQKFVKDQKLTYPIGIDSGGKTKRGFGVRGIPQAYLINVDGRVIWEGHPGAKELAQQLEDELIQTNTYVPKKPLPKSLEKVADQLKSGAFAEAIKLARAVEGAADEVKGLLEDLAVKAKARLARANKLHADEGRTYEASLILQDIVTRYAGIDEAQQAKATLDQWKADPAVAAALPLSQTFYEAEQAEAKGNDAGAKAKYLAVARTSGHKLAPLAEQRARALK